MVTRRIRSCSVGLRVLFPILSLLIVAGCSDGTENNGERVPSCTPGRSISCTCSNGRHGSQTCESDGTFATCECGTMDAGLATTDASAVDRPDSETVADAREDEQDAETICEPDCSAVQCGQDPICGESCGECDGIQTCTPEGKCEDSATWLRVRVGEATVFETTEIGGATGYDVSDDLSRVAIGRPGNDIQIVILDSSEVSSLTFTCENADEPSPRIGSGVRLLYEPIPVEWRFSSWGPGLCAIPSDAGDSATVWDVHVSAVTSERMSGSFEFVIEGGGPREGQTMVVEGRFDEPTPEF